MSYDAIPADLRALAQWICWKSIRNAAGDEKKEPFVAARPMRHASSTDPSSWRTFEEAVEAAETEGFDGIGFVITKDDPYILIDLDVEKDAAGTPIAPLEEWQNTIAENLQSYTEFSPSGEGLHVIVRGSLDKGLKKRGLEIYPHSRYSTFTGDKVPDSVPDIKDANGELEEIIAAHFGGNGSGIKPEHEKPPTEEIAPGERNNALTSLAGKWRRLGMSEAEISAALLVANRDRCVAPLTEFEVRQIARSVSRYAPEPEFELKYGVDEETGEILMPPTLAEFKALEFPPIQPILGPFASQQLNLLFAPTGAGKTMLGLAVAYAMAEGQGFLGWESHGPRRVLYVDGEMAAKMMQERFEHATSSNLWIANIPGWWADKGGDPVNLADEEGQQLLEMWTEGTAADVIILDNFMSLAWRDGVSFTSDEIWNPLRRWMVNQRAANRTVILVDHANTQGQVFGTKTKTHIMDLIGVLEPLEDGPDWEEEDSGNVRIQGSKANLKWLKKRGYGESDEKVIQKAVEIGPIGSDWLWEDPEQKLIREIRQLRRNGLSLREIAEELKVSFSKVQRRWKKVQITDSGDSHDSGI